MSMRETMYDLVLFDLDGTLTDPKIGITKSIQYALSRLGVPEGNPERLVSFIGPPLFESFKHHYSFDEATALEAVGFYREYFSDTGIYENAVYPKIPELLIYLANCGKMMGVATTKPTPFAERILVHFGLHEYFTCVVGSELEPTGVSKSEIIRRALSNSPDIPKGKVIMVGDREHDIHGARDNGIHSIGVTYGYGAVEELSAARPTHLVDSVEGLQALLA